MFHETENQGAPFRTWNALLYYLLHVTVEVKPKKKKDFYDNKHYFV